MRYAVWGRAAAGTREWLLGTFWTPEQAEDFRSEAVVSKTPIGGAAGDQACESALVEGYDGHTAIGDGRPIKKPAKYKPRYQKLVTEVGPTGVKRLVRPTSVTPSATSTKRPAKAARA